MNPLLVFTSEHADSATDACEPLFARPTPVAKRTPTVSHHRRPYRGGLRLRLAIASSLMAGVLIGFAGGYLSATRVGAPAVTPPAMWMASSWALPPPVLIEQPGITQRAHDAMTVRSRAPEPVATALLERYSAAPSPATSRGSIDIASRPDGATVALDGRVLGRTPLSIPSVPAGTHVVGVELPGYSRWATPVHVNAGEHSRVDAWLTP